MQDFCVCLFNYREKARQGGVRLGKTISGNSPPEGRQPLAPAGRLSKIFYTPHPALPHLFT